MYMHFLKIYVRVLLKLIAIACESEFTLNM